MARITVKSRQRKMKGTSVRKVDKKLSAKYPGRRKTKSRSGGYSEYRTNRSDASKKTRL